MEQVVNLYVKIEKNDVTLVAHDLRDFFLSMTKILVVKPWYTMKLVLWRTNCHNITAKQGISTF